MTKNAFKMAAIILLKYNYLFGEILSINPL